MGTVQHDSREIAVRELQTLLKEALDLSIIAQLCARKNDLGTAKRLFKELDKPGYQKLISPDGGSGYLAFQWISESLLKTELCISQRVDLKSFWLLVDAGQATQNVYEAPLREALVIIRGGISGIRTNLDDLFKNYPGNKIGVESLNLLTQLRKSVGTIELSIEKLLSLSPPAKSPLRSKITWKVVAIFALVTLLTFPAFYWFKNGGTETSTAAVVTKATSDLTNIQNTAAKTPTALPQLIFGAIMPSVSNYLLLLSALLGVFRALSPDSRTDLKKMIEELSSAADKLIKIK